ncbi:SsrA-binding protein [Candidatus Hepatincolaceae symbiont of Richtersius coronifer]
MAQLKQNQSKQNQAKPKQNKEDDSKIKVISQNRKALFNYEIISKFEAGLSLLGSEVKTLRLGRCSIGESYISIGHKGELEVVNCSIPAYAQAAYFNHEERRPRKLLLNKKEIIKIKEGIAKKGFTAISLKIYFKKGKAKLEIALAKGKTNYDKRQDLKEKDWKREESKTIKEYNIKY